MKYVALLATTALLTGCSGTKAPEPARTRTEAQEAKPRTGQIVLPPEAQRSSGIAVEAVQLESVSEVLSATGELTVNEDSTWIVGSHIEGRVVSVHANPGDFVAKGFVLARMHSHEVHDARANYRRARDEVARARAAARQAATLRDRAARLLDLKAGSRQDLELAEAHVREAEATSRNADTELERIRVHITEYIQVSLDEKDENVPIASPARGLVLERKVSPGTVVQPGQEAFRMTDPSSLWMIAKVAEGDLDQLRAGQPVTVLVRAHPGRTFRGRILRLGEALDPTTRTLQVRVLVPNPGGLLKPEMYATAEIQSSSSRKALYVAESAVQDLHGSRVVFVRTAADQFEARPIDAVRTLNGRVEVGAGLRPGDQVAVKGSFILKSQLMRSSMEVEE